MSVYGLSDLHLALDMPEKSMEVFGTNWNGYMDRIRENWIGTVKEEDTVIIAGDISWQLKYHAKSKDLDFVKSLPGQKILVRGNHDYWWRRESTNRLQREMPENIHLLMGRSICINNIYYAGTRGWRIERGSNQENSQKIFDREIKYLRRALEEIPQDAYKIAVLHYPPFNEDLKYNVFFKTALEYEVNMIVYGHIHGGEYIENNVSGMELKYISCDGNGFTPKLLLQ